MPLLPLGSTLSQRAKATKIKRGAAVSSLTFVGLARWKSLLHASLQRYLIARSFRRVAYVA